MNDYSQHGEGIIIADFFKDKIGTVVSLGENDGKTLSNVLGLIEVGWRAHLVEPCKRSFDELKARHKGNKNVKCYNYAIGIKDGTIDFFESGEHLGKGDHSLLSSTSSEEIKRWGDTAEFTKTTVKCKTFKSFMKQNKEFAYDLISIDCEGVDYEILTQIPFNHVTTQMVIVETNSVEDQKYIDHMAGFGFHVHFKNFCNLIFVR